MVLWVISVDLAVDIECVGILVDVLRVVLFDIPVDFVLVVCLVVDGVGFTLFSSVVVGHSGVVKKFVIGPLHPSQHLIELVIW